MKSRLRDNGLTLVFGALFLIVLVGEAFAGAADESNQRLADGAQAVGISPRWAKVQAGGQRSSATPSDS